MKNTLDKYVEEGLLYCQVHPTLPLTIYNYTNEELEKYSGYFEDCWESNRSCCKAL